MILLDRKVAPVSDLDLRTKTIFKVFWFWFFFSE